MKIVAALALSAILIVGCFPILREKNGKFLSQVLNLEEFNSEFDDYNSDIASNKSGDTYLLFSSKREKKNLLNLVYFKAEFTYDGMLGLKKTSRPNIGYHLEYYPLPWLIQAANGNFNVYGPNTIPLSTYYNYYTPSKDIFLFYADDADGDMEIKYVRQADGSTHQPEKFNILNSSADDAYPTFSRSGDKILFCSNRDGSFDIYEVTLPLEQPLVMNAEKLINPASFTIRKVEELSGPHQDKCPSLIGDKLVFVSDRPGGFGGFDIYESTFKSGRWSTPVNLGSRINTGHNEYRPIGIDAQSFNYNVMVFSSDRPGGKGGYDLYMTGLDEQR